MGELFRRLFPDTHGEAYVQTEHAAGWHAVAYGFSRAAEALTTQRREFHATVDQVGLAVFFLQRHRVELELKALLDTFDGNVPRSHSLNELWNRLKRSVKEIDSAAWEQFAADAEELVMALHRVDESSFVFRYPQDTAGNVIVRPPYIDLDAVQHYVDLFESGCEGLLTWVRQDE